MNDSKRLIHIRVFCHRQEYDVWMDPKEIMNDFLVDIQNTWLHDVYTYVHFLYHVETESVCDGTKTMDENQIVSGDHLLVC